MTTNRSQNGRITPEKLQGSILDSLICLININYLPKNVSDILILYANDTTAVLNPELTMT